jgi:hypothetical protein
MENAGADYGRDGEVPPASWREVGIICRGATTAAMDNNPAANIGIPVRLPYSILRRSNGDAKINLPFLKMASRSRRMHQRIISDLIAWSTCLLMHCSV